MAVSGQMPCALTPAMMFLKKSPSSLRPRRLVRRPIGVLNAHGESLTRHFCLCELDGFHRGEHAAGSATALPALGETEAFEFGTQVDRLG